MCKTSLKHWRLWAVKYLFIKKNVFCKRKEAENSVSLIRSEFYDAERDLKLLTIIILMGLKNHNLLSNL